MTVLFMDGFEVPTPNKSSGLWSQCQGDINAAGALLYPATVVRSGTGALRVESTGLQFAIYAMKRLSAPVTHLVIGMGFYVDSGRTLTKPSSATMVGMLALLSSINITQIHLGIVPATRLLRVFRGAGTALLGESTTALADNNWYYIELRVKLDATNGEVELRINGNVEFNLSGISTSVGAAVDCQAIRLGITPNSTTSNDFGGSGGVGILRYDDFILFDASESVTWPQGAAIMMLAPEGDGAVSEWNSTGDTHYGEIDEVAFMSAEADGDTSYLSASVEDAGVEVQLSEPTILTGDVLGVQLSTCARNASVGLGQITPYLRLGETVAEEESFGPANSYTWHTNGAHGKNPVTDLPWTEADLLALEIGWKAT